MRLGHAVVALAEQRRIVVGRRAVELHDLLRISIQPVDQRLQGLAHQPAHRHVVEAHVHIRTGAFDGQAVVVDHLHASLARLRNDRCARATVQVHQQQHLRAVGDRLLGLRLLHAGVAFCVDDGVVHAGCLEGFLKEATVVSFPAG